MIGGSARGQDHDHESDAVIVVGNRAASDAFTHDDM